MHRKTTWRLYHHIGWGLALLGVLCIPMARVAMADAISVSESHGAGTPSAAVHTMQDVPGSGSQQSRPQASLDPRQPVRFEQLSLADGLSQVTVYCITQDSLGFMWFGTQDGLNRYDGYDFEVYRPNPEDPDSLSHHHIRAIYEDSMGFLWIGTWGGGLNRLDRISGRMTRFRNQQGDPNSLSNDGVSAILEDREGNLWVGTANGLNRFDRNRQTFTRFMHDSADPNSLSHNGIRVLYQDLAGGLWIGTENGGLDRYDPDRDQFVNTRHDPDDPRSLSSDRILAIHEDSLGALWIGTEGGGLNRLDPTTELVTRFQHDPDDPQSLSHGTVSAVFQDREGILWVGTMGGGLNRLEPDTGQFVRYQQELGNPAGLADDWIWAIYEDRSGLLWIGTVAGGLSKLDRLAHPFSHYQANPHDANSLSDNFVWSIVEDRQGGVWFGTFGGGLDHYDPSKQRWTHYRHDPDDPNTLSLDIVRAIVEDPQGMIWVGTDGAGLDRLDPETGRFTHYRARSAGPLSLQSNTILTLYVDPSGALWVGTASGLHRYIRSIDLFYPYQVFEMDAQVLSNPVVRAILEDTSGNLWVGTEFGLNRLDLASGRSAQYLPDPERPGGLSAETILAIHQDRSGLLWVGTFGGGLCRFSQEDEAFRCYRTKDGLPSDVVYGILEDGQGFLWLSTNSGLVQFDPQNETFQTFDVTHGLQSNEFNAGACYQSPSGQMFFGGVNGANAFYPVGVVKNPYKPPIILTSLTQGGQEIGTVRSVETIQEVTLHWPNNYFEFGFAALSYSQPDRNQYAYKLAGLEDDWIYVGTERYGRYTNLSGRTYTLRVIASNSDGVWNEEGLAVRIRVIPPIWATWWFRGGIALLLVAGVVSGYRIRVRSVEARSRQLETQVQDRTAEIEQRRHELEALFRADEELYRHLDLDDVLQALVDIAVDILKADKSSVICWNESGTELVMRVARGFGQATLDNLAFAPGEGLVGQAVSSGEIAIIEDTLNDPRHRAERAESVRIILGEGIRSFMHIPIRVGTEIFGVFNVNYSKPHAFGEEEQRLFTALAQRAAMAIQNAQLYEQSQELAVIEERNRLARDLHDAVTQTLFSASLIAEALPTLWASDPGEGQQLLGELRQLSRGALAEMRTLLLELRPAVLVEANLGDLLRQLAEAFTGRTGVPVRLVVEQGDAVRCETRTPRGAGKLPSDAHVAFYRIAQEALNNVAKHSNAAKVGMTLRCSHVAESTEGNRVPAGSAMRVELIVQDNGRGFDSCSIPPDRLGLGIIRERAQAIGARLSIDTGLGKGTRVHVIWEQPASYRPDAVGCQVFPPAQPSGPPGHKPTP